MAKTRHIQKRLDQRSIQHGMLELVKMFGMDDGDKIILNRKAIDAAIFECNRISTQMQKMRSRGGLVLIEAGSNEITAYPLESYSRKKRH